MISLWPYLEISYIWRNIASLWKQFLAIIVMCVSTCCAWAYGEISWYYFYEQFPKHLKVYINIIPCCKPGWLSSLIISSSAFFTNSLILCCVFYITITTSVLYSNITVSICTSLLKHDVITTIYVHWLTTEYTLIPQSPSYYVAKTVFTYNYKYLERQFWNIQFIISQECIKLLVHISPSLYSHSQSINSIVNS